MFDQAKADAICARLAQGESLRKACEAEDGPHPATILRWVDANQEFAQQYAQAREIGYSLLADEILEISDESAIEAKYDGEDVRLDLSATGVARNRLRVDSRKWMLSKMLPKRFGDKIDVNHSGGVKFERIEAVVVDPQS